MCAKDWILGAIFWDFMVDILGGYLEYWSSVNLGAINFCYRWGLTL